MRLKPVARETFWSQGKEITSATHNNITTQIAFDRYSDAEKRLYFDVEFTNNSPEPVTIDAGAFYYSAFGRVADSLSEKSKVLIIKAIDPEAELLAIDTKIRDQISLHEKVQVATAVIDIALILVDKRNQTDDERRAESEEKDQTRTNAQIEYEESLQKLYAHRDFWERYALRKTTLLPGKSVRGLIAAPAEERARSLQLYLPCGNSENVITFHQDVF